MHDLRLFLLSGSFHGGDGLAEFKADRPFPFDGAQVFDQGTVCEEIRPQGKGDDGHSGMFRKFDPDGVELSFVKNGRAGRLRKNDDRYAGLKTFFPFFHDGFEIIPRIHSVDCDTPELPHDVSEERHLQKRTLDDKAEILSRTHECVHHGGFEQTHVIADEDHGAGDSVDVVKSSQMEFSAAAFGDPDIVVGIPCLGDLSEFGCPGEMAGTAENVEIAQIKGKTASEQQAVEERTRRIFRCVVAVSGEGVEEFLIFLHGFFLLPGFRRGGRCFGKFRKMRPSIL